MTQTPCREQERGNIGQMEADSGSREVNLGSIEQIPPGEGRQFRIAGRDIAVFRGRDGGAYATQASCPHRSGPLIDGLFGGNMLVCPLHGWKWDVMTGKPLMGDCALATYTTRLTTEGEILVSLPS